MSGAGLAAWRFCSEVGELSDAPDTVRAEWLSLRGTLLTQMRDFESAESFLSRAEEIAPNLAWLCIESSHLLEMEDQYEASLEAARRALALQPWYRPGVQAAAHVLGRLDRDKEALELLTEASGQIETLAHEASVEAMKLPRDHTTNGHAVWLAYDAVCEDDLARAVQYLDSLVTPVDADDRFMEAIMRAAIDIRESADRPKAFVAARGAFALAARKYPDYCRGALRPAYLKVARQAARYARGIRAWSWYVGLVLATPYKRK